MVHVHSFTYPGEPIGTVNSQGLGNFGAVLALGNLLCSVFSSGFLAFYWGSYGGLHHQNGFLRLRAP